MSDHLFPVIIKDTLATSFPINIHSHIAQISPSNAGSGPIVTDSDQDQIYSLSLSLSSIFPSLDVVISCTSYRAEKE